MRKIINGAKVNSEVKGKLKVIHSIYKKEKVLDFIQQAWKKD